MASGNPIDKFIEALGENEEEIQDEENPPEESTKILHNIFFKNRCSLAAFKKKLLQIIFVTLQNEEQEVKIIKSNGKDFFVLDCKFNGYGRSAILPFSVGIEMGERRHIIVYSDCILSRSNICDLGVLANNLSLKFNFRQFQPNRAGQFANV